jgi:hypothetical protein
MKKNKDILAKAIEQLKNEHIPDGPSEELIEATVTKLNQADVTACQTDSSRIKLINLIRNTNTFINLTTKVAAAAVLLVLAGYAIGRLTVPKSPDVEQLQAALEPTIRQKLLQEMMQYWQESLAGGYAQLKDELQRQYRQDLTEFAIQTLAATNTVTNQRLQTLIDAINSAQIENRRSVATALEQIELNRLRDKTQLSNALVGFAIQTEDELLRTKQDITHLLSYTQPNSLVPSEFKNLSDDSQDSNNINKRSKK